MTPGTEGPETLIGREIAGYRLERVLGIGLTGAVFLGRRLADSTESAQQPGEVAIKVLLLPWQMSADERATFRSRFAREAEVLQRLQHPAIVSVLAMGEEDGLTYMVMPYLAGGTLATRLALGRQSLAEANRYLNQLASALDYAHALGIIHRDIKPQNVLLDNEGNAHLADFSIARLLDETRTKLTSTSRLLGTPAYIAPEQLRSGQVSASSDMYSLGAMVFELVTGQMPFDAESLPELALKVTMDPPPLPRSLRPELPEPAEAALWQALDKQPEQRFTSARAFAQAFSAGLQGKWEPGVRPIAFAAQANSQPGSLQWTHTTIPPASQWTPQPPPPPRRSVAPLVLGAIALLLIVGLVFSRNGLGAFLTPNTAGTQTVGLAGSDGATPSATNQGSAPAAPTATPHRGGSGGTGGTGGNPDVSGPQPTTPPGMPTYTPYPTAAPYPTTTPYPTPTPYPTATPFPTPTSTPCPYLNPGNGVTFYSGTNYSGQSWNWYVSPGNNDAYANLPGGIAGNLGSFIDSNSAWHVVLYQSQNGTGNLGHYDNSNPDVGSYWRATQSVKIYVNRAC